MKFVCEVTDGIQRSKPVWDYSPTRAAADLWCKTWLKNNPYSRVKLWEIRMVELDEVSGSEYESTTALNEPENQ